MYVSTTLFLSLVSLSTCNTEALWRRSYLQGVKYPDTSTDSPGVCVPSVTRSTRTRVLGCAWKRVISDQIPHASAETSGAALEFAFATGVDTAERHLTLKCCWFGCTATTSHTTTTAPSVLTPSFPPAEGLSVRFFVEVSEGWGQQRRCSTT